MAPLLCFLERLSTGLFGPAETSEPTGDPRVEPSADEAGLLLGATTLRVPRSRSGEPPFVSRLRSICCANACLNCGSVHHESAT